MPAEMRGLLIEDEERVSDLIQAGLAARSMAIHVCNHGNAGFASKRAVARSMPSCWAIAPQRSFEEFALANANLPPAALRAVLVRAASRMRAEMQVIAQKGQALAFERWDWPDAARVQAALLERLMETVVARGGHPHTVPWEVRAELHSPVPVAALRVKFTPAFGRVMVVSYRPRQAWVDASALSSAIVF